MQTLLSPADLRDMIEAARDCRKCDIVIRGGLVVNVFTGEIIRQNVGIYREHIAAVSTEDIEAERTIDADGLFIAPGFIDGHIHLESSLLTPAEFARAVVPLGTTAAVIDPHEIANVAGSEGIRELARAADGLPLTFYVMAPPCVPASELDASGARMDTADVRALAKNPQVLGIAEVMDYPGVLRAREDLLEELSCMAGRVIDGHAPGIAGRELQAYACAGVTSEHEAVQASEGLEKLRAGMYLMIREGSIERNLDALAALVSEHTATRCLLVSDDLLPTDLLERGHMNYLLSRVVRQGVRPIDALRMVTLNVAQRFKLDRTGAIAPGFAADIAALEDLTEFRTAFVAARGRVVAEGGRLTTRLRRHRFSDRLTRTVVLPDMTADDLAIRAHAGPARVIEAMEDRVTTRQLLMRPTSVSGRVMPDTDKDVLKIAVVERHGRSGSIGLGLIRGFELRAGAIAGSVSHDSHNVVAVGASDQEMLHAIRRVGEMQGGLVAAAGGKVLAELPLPIGGLISTSSAVTTARRLLKVEQAARDLGCRMEHPFMTLSFMSLPVVPELKLTACGLVDVDESRIVPLFAEERGKAAHPAAG